MRVALVYDRVNKWGGAERVLLSLHELFPNAPLYTSVYFPQKARWASVFDVRTSFLQHFPKARESHEFYAPLMPQAFESFTFDEYDLVISVTSEAAKGIITKPHTRHICYCLTPTRYLWSGYIEYFNNPLFRTVTTPLVKYLRSWDKLASTRPDTIISISKEVKNRVKTYYKRDSEVVYPPFDIHDSSRSSKKKGKYFLVVSRLVPYKRVDLAVKACTFLGLPLKVIGTGSERTHLSSIAGPTIEFLGNLTDSELVEYYKGCQALIFPGREDFGLTVVEAMRFGKPVIAYKAGGALETVVDKKTGLFFTTQTIKALVQTLRSFKKRAFKPEDSVKQAEKFSKQHFQESFMAVINKEL